MINISSEQKTELIQTLQNRFKENPKRHKEIEWSDVLKKVTANPQKMWSLYEMERTGGEPDVIGFDLQTGEYIFVDMSKQSPTGRRSLCYDQESLDSRKKNKPKKSAYGMAKEMGVELLTEEEYRKIQKNEALDTKTSSWVKVPENIRALGGAIFCDRRFDTVFTYHNGAESYYASRGFRAVLRV